MTREEVIARIENHKIVHKMNEPRAIYISEALDMAIKALEREPCEDTVSRQAVLNYIYNDLGLRDEENGKDIERQIELERSYKYVKSLPPVTPQPKIGKWFVDERPESNREIICSNCEQPIFKYHKMDFDYRPKYCPNCGSYNGG